jgi:hypothetical protein
MLSTFDNNLQERESVGEQAYTIQRLQKELSNMTATHSRLQDEYDGLKQQQTTPRADNSNLDVQLAASDRARVLQLELDNQKQGLELDGLRMKR